MALTSTVQGTDSRLFFKTLALMRAHSDADLVQGTPATLLGGSVLGDQTSNVYYWDTTSTATDDGETVIKLTNTTTGRFLIANGYKAPVAGSVIRTQASKNSDIISVKDFPGVDPTGSTDSTAAILLAVAAAAGRALDFLDGYTYLVSSSIPLSSNTKYFGKSKIKAANSAEIATGLLNGAAVANVRIYDLELDCNKANLGAHYGIRLVGGSRNYIDHSVYVHDTIQAGCAVDAEDGTIVYGRYDDCGLTGYTDNHGVMVFSTGATPVKDVTVSARVRNAFRKGVTTYSDAPGTVVGIRIKGCVVSGCGLGGIYTGNAPTGIKQESISVNDCYAYNNYVNFELDDIIGLSGSGNVSRNSSGAHGCIIKNCEDVSFGIVDMGAATGGIRVDESVRVNLDNPVVLKCNTSVAGYAPGIELLDSTYCTIGNATVSDADGNMTHGIIEDGTSDYNSVIVCLVKDATSADLTIIGANSFASRQSGSNYGIGASSPLNTLHVGGGLTQTEQAITLANGANNNVALPTKAGVLVSNAPTGVYNITGIAGGHAGRRITILNYTTFDMTLTHQSASSIAANRLTMPGSTDFVVPSFGSASLIYSSLGGGAWFIDHT